MKQWRISRTAVQVSSKSKDKRKKKKFEEEKRKEKAQKVLEISYLENILRKYSKRSEQSV